MLALIENNLQQIAKLCELFAVRKLDLYGSAATGEYREGSSDIDFIYEFGRLEDKNAFHQYYEFKDALEALLGVPVDLNPEPSGRNWIYEDSVNRSRIAVYREEHRCQEVA